MLTLKSSVGKTTSSVIPVKNAGNITARVKIKIEGDSQQFYVKPSQMKLIPEEVGKETSYVKLNWFILNLTRLGKESTFWYDFCYLHLTNRRSCQWCFHVSACTCGSQ